MQNEPRKVREFRRREQEILDTALQLFLDRERIASRSMIADAVGIGKAPSTKHFKSKAEIYLRLMLDYERDLNQLLHSRILIATRKRFRAPISSSACATRSVTVCSTASGESGQGQACPGDGRAAAQHPRIQLRTPDPADQGRIAEGKLEDVPPYFHYCAARALVHGAVALYHSPFWSNVLEDQDGFFQFLMDIGVRMGNKRKRD